MLSLLVSILYYYSFSNLQSYCHSLGTSKKVTKPKNEVLQKAEKKGLSPERNSSKVLQSEILSSPDRPIGDTNPNILGGKSSLKGIFNSYYQYSSIIIIAINITCIICTSKHSFKEIT